MRSRTNEPEEHGRWLSESIGITGMLLYKQTREEAAIGVQALALRVLADKLKHRGKRQLI